MNLRRSCRKQESSSNDGGRMFKRYSLETASSASDDEDAAVRSSSIVSGDFECEERQVKKSVGFSTVRLHTHKHILGDNPSVSAGLPVTLDWDVEQSENFDLEDFEANKESKNQQQQRNKETATKTRKRKSKCKKIPPSCRKEILQAAGHSSDSFKRSPGRDSTDSAGASKEE